MGFSSCQKIDDLKQPTRRLVHAKDAQVVVTGQRRVMDANLSRNL